MILRILKPRFRKAIAFFDYDWTMVRPKTGGTFPKDVDDWQWLFPSVPKTILKYYEKGYAIVIMTNQSKDWKVQQIQMVAESLKIPMTICIARDKAEYKPSLRMMEEAFTEDQMDRMDKKKSFFCGDALGRANDYDNTDKLFAEALGIRVMAPEDFFPMKKVSKPKLEARTEKEVIVMVGMPASGKSTLAEQVFGKAGYYVAHGDEWKTSAKMIKVATKEVEAGKSVVFDATNSSKKKRAEYIDWAKGRKLPVRCVYMSTPLEEALARNAKREKPVPRVAYGVYQKNFEMPTEEEGCRVIVI